ncbi:MAG: Mov34/MPN/PAD-1 family protein [Vicinamibacterales bacterium]
MDESWTLAAGTTHAIVEHAERERPRECCGVLVGRGREIVQAVPVENIAASPCRFLLDPKGHIDARRDARRLGLDVVGYYHSHPNSPAEPSATDAAGVTYTDAVYAIVSLAGPMPVLRLFEWQEGKFQAVRADERA